MMVMTPQKRLTLLLFLAVPLILVMAFLAYMALANLGNVLEAGVKPRVALDAAVSEIRPAFLELEGLQVRSGAVERAARTEAAVSAVAERMDRAGEKLATVEAEEAAPEVRSAMDQLRNAWDRYRAAISIEGMEGAAGAAGDGAAAMDAEEGRPARDSVADALKQLETATRAEEADSLEWMRATIQRHSTLIVINGAMNLLIWIALSFLVLRAEKFGKKAE
ncbi:MAG: hypothetical protein ACLFRG_20525 [Desulfococcaceae bacterium]